METVSIEVPLPVEDALSDKANVRQEILARRDALDPEVVQRKSALIAGNLERLEEYPNAAAVLFYLSKNNEVQTDGMITAAYRSGKKVYVPVTGPDEVKISELPGLDIEFDLGPYGIREPAQKFLKLRSPTSSSRASTSAPMPSGSRSASASSRAAPSCRSTT